MRTAPSSSSPEPDEEGSPPKMELPPNGSRYPSCSRSAFLLVVTLMIASSTVTWALTVRSGFSSVQSADTRLDVHSNGQITLRRYDSAVLAAASVPASSAWAAPSEQPGCVVLSVTGELHVSIASAGHWYGGPSHARAFWPASRNLITRQRWQSNDMLADREKLGSVLEGTFVTSSGASMRLLPSTADFDFSLNAPCAEGTAEQEAAADGGLLCFFHRGVGSPLEMELCTASDVRAANVAMLSRLPRPVVPQQPSLEMMRAPIWSTWARYKMDVTQQKVLNFASEIVQNGYPRSHMEIDDRWSPYYGDLEFDADKFPDPSGMISRLTARGFTTTLWVTPFAEPNSRAYSEGREKGYWLLGQGTHEPAAITWWQGEGVALNVSHPGALDWMEARLRRLMDATGVSGFKFDAGEAQFVTVIGGEANSYCREWAAFAARFGGGGEVRCASGSQSAGIWTREFDKDSRWSHHNGLRSLLTSALHLGVLGYPFVLPDMVGGNAYSDEMLNDGSQGTPPQVSPTIGGESKGEDAGPPSASEAEPPPSKEALSSLFFGNLPARELYVRWCAANALLPAVQFSIAPWQYDADAVRACKKAMDLRESKLPMLEKLAQHAALSGEPIVKPLWYHDPNDPTCQWLDDEFLLGNSTLVAPVLEAGATSRPIYLPRGEWVDLRQRVYRGPTWMVAYPVAADELAIFELRE